MTTVLVASLVAFAASFLLTPCVRTLAVRLGFVDHPDRHRKAHATPTPLGGGLAVLASMSAALVVVGVTDNPLQEQITAFGDKLIVLLFTGTFLVVVGLLDDRFDIRGRQKLAAQLIAVLLVIWSGVEVQRVELFGTVYDLGIVSIPFTAIWLLGAINALNLLDGADGIATSVGAILCLTLAVIGVMTNHLAESLVAVCLLGALLGFLIYNFPPASIYLGDAGSMLIGLVLGTIAIHGSLKAPATVGLAAPLAILAIPFFDTSMAILRRKLSGRSIYDGDRSHVHHRLAERAGPTLALGLISTFCAATAAGALASVWLRNEFVALLAVVGVVSTMIVTGLFGRAEVLLLICRLRSFGHSLLSMPNASKRFDGRVLWQGRESCDEVWEWIVEAASGIDMVELRLDLNVPLLGMGYHGHWRDPELARRDPQTLRIVSPIGHGAKPVGRILLIMARRREVSAVQQFELLGEFLHQCEARVADAVADVAKRRLGHDHPLAVAWSHDGTRPAVEGPAPPTWSNVQALPT